MSLGNLWWQKILGINLNNSDNKSKREATDKAKRQDTDKAKRQDTDKAKRLVDKGKRSNKVKRSNNKMSRLNNKKGRRVDEDEDKKKKRKHFKSIESNVNGTKYINAFVPNANILEDLTKMNKMKLKSDRLNDRIRKDESDTIIKDQIMKKEMIFNWGLGLEHEMQIFHQSHTYFKNKNSIAYGNIMFDSQENTCLLTGDMDPQGACCKKRDECTYFPKTKKDKVNTPLSKRELEWLGKMDWELSGRQAGDCPKGPWILERVPVLMPEIITGDHRNRNLGSICDEIINLRKIYIALQSKGEYAQQKIKKYGPLITHPCGTLDNILIPERPTFKNKEYKLMDKPMKDYLGSYHITITLPHQKNIPRGEFIIMHQRFAQALQWVEPLLVTAYFTGDPASVASINKKIKGSFRIMAVGWGNLGGSDVRKFGSEGVSRGSDIKLYWREKTRMNNTKIIDYCAEKSTPKYPHAVSIQAGDFRTFSFDFSGNCEGNDCPKVDGGKMEPPNGIEIRIFDHFKDDHIHSLLHIVILIAENAQRHPPTDYVYQNKEWINALSLIMKEGWLAKLNDKFVELLRKNLGVKLNTKERIAYRVFKQLVRELFDLNKHGLIPFLMIDPTNINKEPEIPSVNQICWTMSMDQKFGDAIRSFIKSLKKKTYTYNEFKNEFFKAFDKSKWNKDMLDLVYALKILGLINLNEKGIIGRNPINKILEIEIN